MSKKIANELKAAGDKLAQVSDEDKVNIVRSMPWPILKKTYKFIAKKHPTPQCLDILETLKERARTDPETSEKCKDARTIKYFEELLKKYNKL